MSEIKALEKLRGLKTYGGVMVDKNMTATNTLMACATMGEINEIADEIEAEIAERFMELPVDADGVPIRMGDTLQLGDTRGEVVALTYCPDNGKLPWEWQCDTGDWYNTAFARHVKPRTLEDVLWSFADKWNSFAPEDFDGVQGNEVIAECADEIRAMFGEVRAPHQLHAGDGRPVGVERLRRVHAFRGGRR